MRIDGVIFDFNGTLFWDTDKNEAAWRAFARARAGREVSDAAFCEMHGQPNAQMLQFLLGRTPGAREARALSEEKEVLYREMCLADREELRLAPGAAALLDRLKEAMVPCGIATSADLGNLNFYFEHLGLAAWFLPKHIVYSDGTIPGKPAPDFYLRAADVLGVDIAHCAVVEDSATGIKAAQAAGAGRIVGIAPDPARDFSGNPAVFMTIHDFYQPGRWLDMMK